MDKDTKDTTDMKENNSGGVDSKSNCPQTEVKEEEENEWNVNRYNDRNNEIHNQSQNDEGYEGDMEGDGGLMPPPSSIP